MAVTAPAWFLLGLTLAGVSLAVALMLAVPWPVGSAALLHPALMTPVR